MKDKSIEKFWELYLNGKSLKYIAHYFDTTIEEIHKYLISIDRKRCKDRTCNITLKSRSEFGKCKTSGDGLINRCNECVTFDNKNYKDKHREKMRDYNR